MKSLVCIVGDGPTRESDILAFQDMDVAHQVCCINRAGLHYPTTFPLWYSYHAKDLAKWAQRRPGSRLLSCNCYTGIEYIPLQAKHTKGGSAMQALRICLDHLGFSRVVLAGVPLSGPYRTVFGSAWEYYASLFADRVRSLSGFTMELFGTPEKEWIDGLLQ